MAQESDITMKTTNPHHEEIKGVIAAYAAARIWSEIAWEECMRVGDYDAALRMAEQIAQSHGRISYWTSLL